MSSIHYVGKDDLELPFKCWDYSCVLPCLVYVVLGVKPRALYKLGKSFAIEPCPKPLGDLMYFWALCF